MVARDVFVLRLQHVQTWLYFSAHCLSTSGVSRPRRSSQVMRSHRTSSKRFVPTASERLEPRLALSGASTAHVSWHSHSIVLNGQLHGQVQVIPPTTTVHTYTIDETTGKVTQGPDQIVPIPDAPNTMVFHGQGHIGALGSGSATLSGSLYQGGFHPANAPDINGNLTLTTHKGSILLSVTGGSPAANAKSSYHLSYRIVSGTGAFTHVRGSGKMLLQSSALVSGSASFHLSLPDKSHGA